MIERPNYIEKIYSYRDTPFVKVLTGGGPAGSSEVFLSYLYKQAYDNASYGYGMAIGVLVFLFSFLMSAILNKVTERDTIQM